MSGPIFSNNNNNSSSSSSDSSRTKPTTVSGNSSRVGQACAACKFQRRKCAPDCLLAPYFPANDQRQFLNAHKLFGVMNITKILRSLQRPLDREIAVKSIIAQANARAADPVGGCYRIIYELQRQIERTNAELQVVVQHLGTCRARAQDYLMQNPGAAGVVDPLMGGHYPMQVQAFDYSTMLGFDEPRNCSVKVDMLAAAAAAAADSCCSSMVVDGKRIFVDESLEDIKPPLVGMVDQRTSVRDFSDKTVLKEEEVDHASEPGVIEMPLVLQQEQEQGCDRRGAASLFRLTNDTIAA